MAVAPMTTMVRNAEIAASASQFMAEQLAQSRPAASFSGVTMIDRCLREL
ncbi:MAG: hypothetical protein ACR2KS_05610 [Candidatus Eremiobacter antarcticus]|nr:hypothetical protein [Candidatus Eremiobacteraeota bacterium]MBC5808682.1 hypothetical protein [Candidatus Eremiobacteraeota bacterium]